MKKILILSLLIAQNLCAQNLILNSTFDNDVDHWQTGGPSTVIVWNNDGNISNGSIQIDKTLNNGSGGGVGSNVFSVLPNTNYRLVVSMKPLLSSEAIGANTVIYWYNSSGNVISDTDGYLATHGESWAYHLLDTISPSNANTAQIVIGPLTVNSGSTNISSALFDDIYFLENDDLFIDGFE